MRGTSGRESTSVGRRGSARGCPYRGIMPRCPGPLNERQALEQELAEPPAQIAAYRQELADTPPLLEFKARRERLDWQIQECEKRRATITVRLAAIKAEGGLAW